MKTKEIENIITEMLEKQTQDINDLKNKHQNNLKMIEAKFQNENQVLTEEFIFLSGELQKLQNKEILLDQNEVDQKIISYKNDKKQLNKQNESSLNELQKQYELIQFKKENIVD